MGLGGMKYAWQRQTKDFAHAKGDRYSSLVIDNRGIGESDKPTSRYSTSEMAKDIVEVVDHLGWTGKRELHIIGISMGGMIAQELVRPLNLRNASLADMLHPTLSSCSLASLRILHHPSPNTRCQGCQTLSEPLQYPAISTAQLIPTPLRPTPPPPIFLHISPRFVFRDSSPTRSQGRSPC
jgi:pimeloyl-ACP methyl ester carboxylesterase